MPLHAFDGFRRSTTTPQMTFTDDTLLFSTLGPGFKVTFQSNRGKFHGLQQTTQW
jgi:hypothetical protein